MPTQLLRRLNRFLDQQIGAGIMALELTPRGDTPGPPPPPDPLHPNKPAANTTPHWPRGTFGDPIASVKSVMIHETSGWPSYASSGSFQNLFRSIDSLSWHGPDVTGHWEDKRGIGPQYFVDPNGTAFALIGAQNLAGDARLTWHGETMNLLCVGIENGDLGDSGVGPGTGPGAGNGPRWWRLSNDPQDLPGRKAFLLLHPRNAEDASLIWIAQFPPANSPLPSYTDAGDIANVAGWDDMIFTERDYRTLVLLCRLLAEQFGIPRNFLILPYLSRADRSNAALFRRMILADQLRDSIAQKLGTTTAVIQADGAPYTTWYNAHQNANWSRFFGADPAHPRVQDTPCYKGFLSHTVNGGHPCPGPFFDWHRFAREVWDWWWYPFDVDNAGAASVVHRPYRQARRDTPLVEYYWDAIGTAAQREALRLPQSITETFRLPADTPIYALANGVVVGARLSINDPATGGFLLVRHELFHQGANGRIDYDLAPTFVWTLTYHLGNAGFSIPAAPPAAAGAMPATNPDWLKRFIIRLRECELAVAFHTAHAANTALTRGWNHVPSGAGPRLSSGQEIERDAAAYRTIANDLSAGRVALFPLESQTATTPVRVCLGEFLGFPGRIPVVDVDAVRFEIFSLNQLPVPGALHRGVTVTEENEPWWATVTAAARHEDPAGADLPANGIVWQYGLAEFLQWANNITWASEWQKYDVTAAAGGPAPARPVSRT